MKGLMDGEFAALRARKITEETCRHFGYKKGEIDGKTVQIAPYFDDDGQMVAQKIRFANKDFRFLGKPKTALPFGAHAFQKTGKMITVTEGEVDALSMSQAQNNKWPVVSIGCGAGPQVTKYMAQHKGYFAGFETVVLMFDMDEPGRQAAKDAARVLGARARIAELPLKDASDMLVAGRVEELINAMWKAREYRPEGIVAMADLKEQAKQPPAFGLSWPLETLTGWTYGIRLGEILTLGAGTGVGKTDFLALVMKHLVVEHKVPIGVFSLEQSPVETAQRLAGKVAGHTFHIPDTGWTDADFEASWKTITDAAPVFLYDSFGQNDWDVIQEQIEYLHHAHSIQYFFVDHLTALAAWQDDERKALEVIMSEMGGLVKKLNITIFLVSHLATPDGKSHEEGGRVELRHLKGSRSIVQWSHYVIGLERDQQADDIDIRLTTFLRMLKDRYTGRSTGKVLPLGYNETTGLLYETKHPSKKLATTHGFKREADDEPEGDEI